MDWLELGVTSLGSNLVGSNFVGVKLGIRDSALNVTDLQGEFDDCRLLIGSAAQQRGKTF